MTKSTTLDNIRASLAKNSSGIFDARFWMWITVAVIGAIAYGVVTS